MRRAILVAAVLSVLPFSAAGATPQHGEPSPMPSSVPGLVLAADARIGADPPLREPVEPTGRVVQPDRTKQPDWSNDLGPVGFEVWLPQGTAGPGDRLAFDVRITNRGKRTIRLYCPGFNLGGWTASLFPMDPYASAETQLDRLAFGMQGPGLLLLPIVPMEGENGACEGKELAARFPLAAGRALDVRSEALLVAPYGGQALPAGQLHITSGVQWTPKGGGRGGALGSSGEVAIAGPAWPWANPTALLDAIDAVPEVATLLDRADGFEARDVEVAAVLERLPGWTLPEGVAPAHLLGWQLVPLPATPDDGATAVTILVDPWTAQVIAVLPD